MTLLKGAEGHAISSVIRQWQKSGTAEDIHLPVMGVDGTVGYPVLLSQRGGRVDDELLAVRVVFRRGLHLNSIVAVAQLSQPCG